MRRESKKNSFVDGGNSCSRVGQQCVPAVIGSSTPPRGFFSADAALKDFVQELFIARIMVSGCSSKGCELCFGPRKGDSCVKWLMKLSPIGRIIDSRYSTTVHDPDLPCRADRCIPDLHDLPRVYGWEPCNLHNLSHLSWVGSALHRSCTTFDYCRLGS